MFENVRLLIVLDLLLSELFYFPQNLLIDNNRVFSTPDDEEGRRKLKDQSEQQRIG